MRVALAATLFTMPDLLLLDEPTNHLDLEATLWLEGFLKSYPHTILMVSHDRDLLNRAVDGIVHLEAAKLVLYSGRLRHLRADPPDEAGAHVGARPETGGAAPTHARNSSTASATRPPRRARRRAA